MPRSKLPTVEEEGNAVTRHESQLCCHWEDHRRCQNYGVIVKAHVVKWCKPSENGDVVKKLVAIGYCAEHDHDSPNVLPKRQETVTEYFDRTYKEALKNDPLVRGAVDEDDKSLLMQMVMERHSTALKRMVVSYD